MLVCKCDKCGETFEMEKGAMLMTSMQAAISLKTQKYDLCDKCWNDFNLWIRGHAEFVPKTKVDEFGQPYCTVYDDEDDKNTEPDTRDCENCKHYQWYGVKNGCTKWECHFERKE